MRAWAEIAGSWRVAVRLARRTAYRNRARTALIVGMLAVPVYAGTVLALAYTGTYRSADTEASWLLGTADLSIEGPDAPRALASLPDGSRTTPFTTGRAVVRAGDRYTVQEYEAVDALDPLARGLYMVRTGRAPRGAAEVAVSTSLAEALRVRVGDALVVGVPPGGRTVVGVLDATRELDAPLLVVDQPPAAGTAHTLIKLPPGAAWTPTGGNVGTLAREAVGPDAAEQAVRAAAGVVVTGFAGVQIALLTGAAFAVGARRQRRELAMVGAAGATRAQIARIVLANGLVLGAFAGILGVGLGALTFWLNRARVERIANHPLVDSGAPLHWLLPLALVSVLVGLLAAAGPARGTARQAIPAALAGRETSSRASSLRWLTGGLLVAAGGAAVATVASGPTGSILTVTAGTVAVLLGVAACAPSLVTACGLVARRLPLAARLAGRHAARHRLRTAASVAAICAAVAGSVALMLFNSADTATGVFAQPNARPGQVLVPAAALDRAGPERLRAIEQALPVRSTVEYQKLTRHPAVNVDPSRQYRNSGLPPDASQVVAIGGAELIRAVTGAEPPPEALAALRDGGAVVFHPELLRDGVTTLLAPDDPVQQAAVRLPAALVPAPDYHTDLPGTVISARTAARHRLAAAPGGAVIDTTRAPTAAELATANSRMLELYVTSTSDGATPPPELSVGARPPLHRRDLDAMFLILAVVSAVVTLAASAVAVGLAAAEMRNDLSTLAAVGAGPRLRRRIAAAQAGLIVGLGTPLGVLAGIAPAAALVAFRTDLVWDVPWVPLALTVVVAPLLAVALTGLLTRPRLVLVRRLA